MFLTFFSLYYETWAITGGFQSSTAEERGESVAQAKTND
jgi:hypothetical protein